MAIKVSGTEVISDDKRILNNESLPDIRPSLLLDFANSKTLDPRITFTRGSTATYYDGKTTAKAEENLVVKSQEFDHAAWGKVRATVTANAATAPDGSTTADYVEQVTGETLYGNVNVNSTPFLASSYVLSVYAKQAEKPYVVLVETAADTSFNKTHFNLSTGAVGTTDAGHTATITDVGNGWYRCSIGFTMNAARSGAIAFYVADTDNSQTVTDSGGVYLWGAQLEQRSSATAYTATTTSPIVKYQPVLQTAASGEARLDHDPVTGESRGLLIEEARTNFMTNSETFDTWNKNNTSVSANATVAPDGTLSADKVYKNNTTNQASVSRVMSAATGDLTFTFYVKSAEYDTVGFTLYNATDSHVANGSANLTNGTTNTSAGTIGIEDIGHGWWRIRGSGTATASNSVMYIYPKDSTSYQGNGYSGIYVWGAQVEVGSFPTSYIPTSGSTVTRVLDTAKITDLDTQDWHSNDQGTLFADFGSTYTGQAEGLRVVNIVGNSGTIKYNLEGYRAEMRHATAYTAISFSNETNSGGKVVMAYDNTGFDAASYGLGYNAQSVTPTYEADGSFRIGSYGLSAISTTIKKVAYYPQRLPSAALEAMTEE